MYLEASELNITAKMKNGVVNRVVKDLSFSVDRGKKLAIVGRSGCGKTMTAMSVLGLLPDNCTAVGSIRCGGKELLSMKCRERKELLGTEQVLIPQSGADFLNPALTVRRQMEESYKRAGIGKQARREKMKESLHNLGFASPEKILPLYPFQLSGGMAQRVVMAMAAAGNPALVIADEPTKGIDKDNTELFLRNIDLMFPQAAVILITHDISVAAACDDILVIKDGSGEEYGRTEDVLSHPQSAYTRELISDLPHALSRSESGE